MSDHFADAGKPMPEALRLADELDGVCEDGAAHYLIYEAADELRRLHDENEALKADSDMLRKIGALCRNQTRFTGGYDEIVKCSLTENERLSKALRDVVRTYMVADESYDPEAQTDKCIAIVMERLK